MLASRPRGFAIDAGRRVAAAALLLLLGIATVAWWRHDRLGSDHTIYEPQSRFVEPGAMCPWREPEEDMRRFFPTATRYTTETRILSAQRLELQQRLGRPPTGEENSLYIHRIQAKDGADGAVLTRRVRGEHGVVELVLALDRDARVLGLKVQRLREPEAVAEALEDPRWLSAFQGKTAADSLALGVDLPDVRPEAKVSAERIAQGVRDLLILHAAAESRPLIHGGH